MAKITTRAGLVVGTELTVDETARTITLNVAGNLVAKDGVTWQALYSKLVELWSTATYQDSPFPCYAIDALSGQFQIGTDGARFNNWTFGNAASRTYLRDGGWSEYIPTTPGADGTSATGTLARQYVGIVGLGSVSAGAQLYYQRLAADAPLNFTFSDQCNEGIQVFGDATNGNFDKRTYFKGFVREYAKKYKDSVLSDTGKTATGAYLVNMLLSNEDDLDVVANDATVAATSPYTDIGIRYFASAFQKDIDTTGTPRSFGVVVDVGTHSGIDGAGTSGGSTLTSAAGGITGANYTGGTVRIHNGAAKGVYNISGTPTATVVTISGTLPGIASGASFTLQRAVPIVASLKQIYTKVQYQLRQATDIDGTSGTVTGKTAGLLLNFVGSRLDAGFFAPSNPNGGGSGVLVEGVGNADTNSIRFFDNTSAQREYPFSSSGTITFNAPLVGAGGYYRLFHTALPGATNDWGESGAVTVNDASGSPITGVISSGSITFTFDYSNNSQGGRTPNTDAPVTLVCGKPGTAKPVIATGILTQSKAIALSAVAETDRAYI